MHQAVWQIWQWAGPIGLAVQAVVMTGIIAALWYFTKDDRFKPVYAGWLGASLMAFPALALRFFGANNDQLGFIYQIVICVIAFFIVSKVREVKIDWKRQCFACIVPCRIWRGSVYGLRRVRFTDRRASRFACGFVVGLLARC